MRLFVSMVQAGSLSSVSELTGIAVSKLSRRLTHLENTLGTQLLNCGKKASLSMNLVSDFLSMPKICSKKQIMLSAASIRSLKNPRDCCASLWLLISVIAI
ncbi:LysR family transcriptional regulator [Moraxella catarrhalis]|uniref:helix-turn-helix domain-containing protein n=2 Tax=Moraxellaceae TaxID=468 RepID=UPI0038574071